MLYYWALQYWNRKLLILGGVHPHWLGDIRQPTEKVQSFTSWSICPPVWWEIHPQWCAGKDDSNQNACFYIKTSASFDDDTRVKSDNSKSSTIELPLIAMLISTIYIITHFESVSCTASHVKTQSSNFSENEVNGDAFLALQDNDFKDQVPRFGTRRKLHLRQQEILKQVVRFQLSTLNSLFARKTSQESCQTSNNEVIPNAKIGWYYPLPVPRVLIIAYPAWWILFCIIHYQWRRKHVMTGPARPRARDYVWTIR